VGWFFYKLLDKQYSADLCLEARKYVQFARLPAGHGWTNGIFRVALVLGKGKPSDDIWQ
jgi:hypothetical protein